MPSYNFLREAKVYIVYGGNQYNVDISNVSFSQTFTEESYVVKTLHTQTNMFEGSVINTANPANFSLTLPMLRESDFSIVFDLLIDYDATGSNLKSFDLYVSTEQDVFKLETCVITNGSFIIEKLRPLSLTVSGEASKLTKVGTKAGYTIPGSVQSRTGSLTYNRVSDLTVTLNSSTLSDITRVAVELQNEINWTPYKTVNNAVAVTSASNSMFPTSYTLEKRILAGSLQQYVTDTNGSDLFTWDTGASLRIQAGQNVGGTLYGIDLNMTACSFTNRMATAQVFVQNYDWRLLQNPTDLGSIFTYTTL